MPIHEFAYGDIQGILKRLGQYLRGHRRMVYTYPFKVAERVDIYSDTDGPGCARTRRSTSGACVMVGKHCTRTWKSTQPSVTLVKVAGAFIIPVVDARHRA